MCSLTDNPKVSHTDQAILNNSVEHNINLLPLVFNSVVPLTALIHNHLVTLNIGKYIMNILVCRGIDKMHRTLDMLVYGHKEN